MDTKEVFIMRFRAARKELGLSQKELADKLGVSRTIVSDWEQGRSSPGMDKFTAISNTLEKPLVYFFSASESEGQSFLSNAEFAEGCEMAIAQVRELRSRLLTVYRGLGFLVDFLSLAQAAAMPGRHSLDPSMKDIQQKLVRHFAPKAEIDEGSQADLDGSNMRRSLSFGMAKFSLQSLGWLLDGDESALSSEDRQALAKYQGKNFSDEELTKEITESLISILAAIKENERPAK